MTYDDAQSKRLAYFASGLLVAAIAIVLVAVTLLKYVYLNIYLDPTFPLTRLLRFGIEWLRDNVFSTLWGWLPDTRGYLSLLPFYIMSFVLMMAASSLIKNGKKLTSWMREVRALEARESMLASRRPRTSTQNRQSIGDINSSHNVNINQEIANHYNNKPDSPIYAISIAVIGAVSAIVTALIAAKH